MGHKATFEIIKDAFDAIVAARIRRAQIEKQRDETKRLLDQRERQLEEARQQERATEDALWEMLDEAEKAAAAILEQ